MSILKSLGYITVATSDIDRWRQFAFGVLGFAEGSGPDPSALYLRMDERAARIVIVEGETDEIVTIGWEVRDGKALARVRDAVTAAGVSVTDLSGEEADARRIEAGISFTARSSITARS
jgi:3,4-dihydroxy-9,10-secoandrosta-1,3,5(10)-triene-9,17-dione 4,5-dioxygenase